MPREFAGTVGIEWPPGGYAAGAAMPGWKITPYDADGPVMTVQEITLHCAADSLIWAELTMFADEEGRPVLHGNPVFGEDGKPLSGTFPFLVTSMRVR